MSKTRIGNLQKQRAFIQTESFNNLDNTIDVVFVTDTPVLMEEDGQRFYEVLSCDPSHIRLERLEAGAPFLKVHDPTLLENQIGIIVKVWFENNQGFARIKLSQRDDCFGIVNDIKAGIIKNISVGYDVLEHESGGTASDGLPILRAIDWEPAELSAVPIPADYKATTRSKNIKTLIQNLKPNKMAKTREEKIRSLAKRFGVAETVADQMIADNVTVEDALEKIMDLVGETPSGEGDEGDDGEGAGDGDGTRSDDEGGDDGEGSGDGGDDGEGDDKGSQRSKGVVNKNVDKKVIAERARSTKIFAAARAAKLSPEFALKLIENGTSVARASEIIVNKMAAMQKTTNVRVQGRDEADTARAAVEQALLHRSRPGDHKITIDKAKEYRGFSLVDFAKDALVRSGEEIRGFSKHELTVRALTTSDFPALLSNVTNKILRKAYEEAPATWKPLANQMTATDFKDITGIQIGGGTTLEEVLEDGEYKFAQLKESAEKFRLKTYGKIIKISRQAIINDDLNGFARTAQLFGNAAANRESDIMWSMILGNPVMADGKTLFHTAHKNIAASAAPLSVASLSAARTAISRQTGLGGEVLNLLPKYLVVPPELLTVAEQLMTAINSTETGTVNPFTGKYNIISDARITDVNAWYLVADPAMIDTLSYAYLEGHEGLYTEQREGWNSDGVEIKARLDFGAVVWDYRGFYKNAGA